MYVQARSRRGPLNQTRLKVASFAWQPCLDKAWNLSTPVGQHANLRGKHHVICKGWKFLVALKHSRFVDRELIREVDLFPSLHESTSYLSPGIVHMGVAFAPSAHPWYLRLLYHCRLKSLSRRSLCVSGTWFRSQPCNLLQSVRSLLRAAQLHV